MAGYSPSVVIPEAEIYAAEVKAKFQSAQRLQSIMAEVSNVGGAVRHDWVGSTQEMSNQPFGASELPTAGVKFTPVQTVPLRFTLKTAIAEADQSITNINLRQAHTKVHGLAAARMVDILKIRAVFDNPSLPITDFATVAKTIGPDTGLNTQKFTAMATGLNNEAVDEQFRYLWANSDQYQSLFNEEKYTNAFYMGEKTLPTYGLKEFAGLNPLMLAKSASNSIPVTAVGGPPPTSYTSYACASQYDAMQFMYNMPLRTVVSYDQQNLNWVIVTEFVANAQVIQKEGIILSALELDTNGAPLPNP